MGYSYSYNYKYHYPGTPAYEYHYTYGNAGANTSVAVSSSSAPPSPAVAASSDTTLCLPTPTLTTRTPPPPPPPCVVSNTNFRKPGRDLEKAGMSDRDREFKETGTYTHTIDIDADEQKVWSVFENVEGWPEWNNICSKAEGKLAKRGKIVMTPHNCPSPSSSSSSCNRNRNQSRSKSSHTFNLTVTKYQPMSSFTTDLIILVPFILRINTTTSMEALPPRYTTVARGKGEEGGVVAEGEGGAVTRVTMVSKFSGLVGWLMRHAAKEIGIDGILQKQLDDIKEVVEKER